MINFVFDRNKKTVKEIYDGFGDGKLVVDLSYQRRRLWLSQDNVRLIETILMGLIVPEVFFWTSTTDAETGETVTHIVDGQQRINAIVDFITGQYPLNCKFLTDIDVSKSFGNLFFSQLPDAAKTQIWTYSLSIVNIDRNCKKGDIRQMFYRLNMTNYSLNEQEKRNSIESSFGEVADALLGHDFWVKYKVFNSSDVRRMTDTEFCCTILILALDGIVDQTNKELINKYYDEYKESFDSNKQCMKRVETAIDIIEKFIDKETMQFASKKTQMYTLFSLAFDMLDNEVQFSENMFVNFKLFVIAYNNFRNEYEFAYKNDQQRSVFESIKRYKLASSEGISKLSNRVIRFEVLKNTCILSSEDISDWLKALAADFDSKNNVGGEVKFEDLEIDDIEI